MNEPGRHETYIRNSGRADLQPLIQLFERARSMTSREIGELLHSEGRLSPRLATALMVLVDRAEQTRPQVLNYREYLRSPEWRAIRAEKLRQAGNQCALCPNTKRLEVHHRTYDRLGKERPDDLIVLCDRCHRRQHAVLAKGVTSER